MNPFKTIFLGLLLLASPLFSLPLHNHPLSWHILYNADSEEGFLQLEDGSVWSIREEGKEILAQWDFADPLVITPNTWWGGLKAPRWTYCMTNKRTKESLYVNLFGGPDFEKPATHWIVAIDSFSGRLFLENGTVWQIAPGDSSRCGGWGINNPIIFGENDEYFSPSTVILINASSNDYVRARQQP